MINVTAKIVLYKNSRKTPFLSGYRPMFNFIAEMKTSGKIRLLDRDQFSPGEEGIIEICFLHSQYLGAPFGRGTKFTFGEGREALGEGEIIEILSEIII